MARAAFMSPAARFLILGACLVILIAGLRAASSFLGPTLLALFIAIAVVPIVRWLDNRGLPTWASVLVVVLAVLAIGLGLIGFVTASVTSLSDSLPAYQENLAAQVAVITAWLTGHGVTVPPGFPGNLFNVSRLVSFVGSFLGLLVNGVSSALLVLLLFVIFLAEAAHTSGLIRERFGSESAAVARFVSIGSSITSYFRVRALNNLFVSVALTILLYALGVDLAGLWGVLAFFLGYIPNIGLPLAVAPAVLLAWIERGGVIALIVIGGTLVINFIGDNVLTPRLAGKALNMSTATVFMSFIFWSWVFGAIGALISIPLTAIVIAALDNFSETRWVATLMSAGSVTPSPEKEAHEAKGEPVVVEKPEDTGETA